MKSMLFIEHIAEELIAMCYYRALCTTPIELFKMN